MIRFCLLLLVLAQNVQAQRPNIVLIVADDLGYGDLSSFGAADLETPHIDALAEGGMRFTGFYANSPVCSPTRAAIMSGRYPDLVGVPGVIRTHEQDSWGYLAPDAVLLPQMLRGAGYHTALVGKWHLGLEPPNVPTHRGFDVFRGFLGDMMDDYYTHRRHGINYMRRGEEAVDPEGHATDLFTDWAVEYVEERAREQAPFFLYLAYNAPHDPIQPPPDRVSAAAGKRAGIAALIEHMDEGIGRVVSALRETGEMENTLILFVSDNGGALVHGASNGDLRGGKQDMYEGGIRVPAFAYWSGRIQPSVSAAQLSTVDIYPTLAEVARGTASRPLDGVSFLPLLIGEGFTEPHRSIVFVRREGNDRYMGLAYYAVQRGDWKLLQNTPTGPFELYNLKDDPAEQHDLIESRREVFSELAHVLRLHIMRSGSVRWRKP